MKHSTSVFLDIRGLRYHCRTWGSASSTPLLLLHGWMDVSASFQFLVDALEREWYVIAPDWRGFGETAWSSADSYWFPDYYGDLDQLVGHFSPSAPMLIAGHSMGGNVACIYAGVRPERVAKLVNLEGFGLRATEPQEAPKRIVRWLDELHSKPRFRDYASFDELAQRLRDSNSRLTPARAVFLARHWGMQRGERVVLRSDPAHKLVNAVPYQLEEAKACWCEVCAPVLWVSGKESKTPSMLRLGDDELQSRIGCFENIRTVSIADAGHMLHHDQPEQLARLMENFLSD